MKKEMPDRPCANCSRPAEWIVVEPDGPVWYYGGMCDIGG